MFVEEKTQGEPQPTKEETLKLSAAMKIGIARTEWMGKGPYISMDGRYACAWGAAAIGYGGDRDTACGLHGSSAFERAETAFLQSHGVTIVSANDERRMTREQIADWLESQGY